jgi:dTDP-4-amino-4,6-dideoxygalactose transaminase
MMEFNDVRFQYEALRKDIDLAVADVLSGGRYILGPAMRTLEDEFARYCGVTEGVAVASGTDALSIGLTALGVGKGDDVLVPALSAAATAVAVVMAGARPVFVDISREDFMLDPAVAAERMTSRSKAVVPVHLYGMPARLKELSKLGLAVLEDSAQAHGADADWGRCGTFGRAAAFSFYPTKNLGTYGDGGMLVTSDPALADSARLLRNYGQRENYSSETPGRNSRLDEIHAAILHIKLAKLDEWNRRRREVAEVYRAAFKHLPVTLQMETGKSNYHLFVLCTPERDRLRAHLASKQIPTLVHYPIPLSRQKAFAEFDPAPCPNADLVCSTVLSLPIHAFMSDGDVENVVNGVLGFFERKT